jgi:replicative DNA helicase
MGADPSISISAAAQPQVVTVPVSGGDYSGPRDRKAARDNRGRDWKQLSKLFEALPPHAIEAEMSLLGSILIDPQVLGDVIFIVRHGDDFYKPANGALFDAMVELYDKNSSLDIVQLNQRLIDRNVLDAVGGLDYLVQLASAVPSAANARHYARLVREKAMVRKLIGAAGDILYDAYHSAEQAQDILDQAEQRIFQIAQQSEHTQVETLHELIRETMERIEANLGQELSGISSGFRELDEMTTGLQKGELLILAARPSMGKTALALNMAENMAMRGTAVGVFSLEMGKQQLVQRLLCARSGIDSQRLRRNMLREPEFRALMTACDELQAAPMFIDDTPGLSLLQLRAKARRMAAKHKVQAIVIDYLQLMSSGARVESRQVEVSEISRGVKAMARELNVPVICLSQLNRAAESREGHRPRMSDLRESGSIEQDADVIMMLHREEYYHKDDPDWVSNNPESLGVAELILAKQRNGPTGTVKLSWVSQSTRFRDHSSSRPPSGYAEPRDHYTPQPPRSSGGAVPFSSLSPNPDAASKPPFSAGKSGPVQNFRDGGGPDREVELPRGAPPADDEFDDDLDGIPV